MSDMISTTEAKLQTHEAICAQRYEHITHTLDKGDKRMTKIEYSIWAVLAAVLLGPGAAAEFFKKLIGTAQIEYSILLIRLSPLSSVCVMCS